METTASDIWKSVLTQLECPVCKEYIVSPITSCLGGHNICNNCRPSFSSCPTCKQKLLEITNFRLEKLLMQIKFPCRYSKNGCKDAILYNALREHEAICGYSPQTCPVDYLWLKMICTWTGISKDVKKHLHTAHKDLCEDYNDQHLLLLPCSSVSIHLFKFLIAYNEIFCYRFIIQCGRIYVVLHYIGSAENDSKYQYAVIVRNNEGMECVVVTDLARRCTETDDQSFFPKNCFKLHSDHIERFKNEKGELSVMMKILRVDD